MSDKEKIILRPTRWFLLRAGAMLAMFGIFAGWFLYDWKVGYPKQNLAYALMNTFEKAGKDFEKFNSDGNLTPSGWENYVASQTVELPDPALLPPGTPHPMPWPEILKDYGRMADEGWSKLWLEYSAEHRMPDKPPEHPVSDKVAFDAKKLKGQKIFAGICAALALGAAFVLVRTLRRTMEADSEALVTQDGRRIEYERFDRLDKRKWKTKGLAYVWFDDNGKTRKVRIDGLTYGGFRKEDGEPAEHLMERLESNFSGELIDYVEDPPPTDKNPS
jgi:hypothetical protein